MAAWVHGLQIVAVLLFLFFVYLFVMAVRNLGLRLEARVYRGKEALQDKVGTVFLALGALVGGVMAFGASKAQPLPVRLALSAAIAAGIAMVWWVVSEKLAAWVQERGESRAKWAEEAEKVCHELRGNLDSEKVSLMACEALSRSLSATRVMLFVEDGQGFKSAYASGPSPLSEVEFPWSSLLVAELAAARKTASVVVADPITGEPRHWTNALAHVIEAEQRMLEALDARLAVSLRGAGSLRGFFLIGPRDPEREYGTEERQFAEIVAEEVSRVLDSSSHALVHVESRADERLAELEREMAQAATLRLIGPDRPELPGVDYAAGYWRIGRPAGQYYDLISLPKGSLGLVLAEVGLQGLDAAIQVVQLQTLLRSRFQPYCDDLSELMESTQRALVSSYGGSAPVSLFVARYHPQSRVLHYVNAGHFAPFLLRFNDDGAEALRLLAKGNALCSPEPTPWAESEIRLRASDVLGLASSGFPSTANEEGATFGEGRLIDALMSWTGRTAKDLVGLTLKSAEDFAGEQYDNPDRLLMVLKCE